MAAGAYGWLGAIVMAAAVFVFYMRERRRNRAYKQEIRYIGAKLEQLTGELYESREQFMLVTAEPESRELLRAVNALLGQARRAASDYAAAERAMRQMLANMSHDLRTPLTVIAGYAEMLDASAAMPEEERRRLLGKVRQKSADVLELMNRLFELARLEADDVDLPVERLDAVELCRRSLLGYYELLAARSFEVEAVLPSEPVWVDANAEALVRVLDNLLSNAIKYGEEGRYIGLYLEREDDAVAIRVVDRGPGIPRELQRHVFERLYTLDESRNQDARGSGLGLTIAARLVERLGGSIAIESKPWARTSFIVRLRTAAEQPGGGGQRGADVRNS